MHPVLWTNIHHDVTDLVNHGIVKNTKTWISWKQNIIFLQNKKILNLCLRWHILRSYRFLAEVTFKKELLQFFVVIGQTLIVTVDQPLFALAKEVQWAKPETLGEYKLLVMMGDLHIEMTFMKCLGVILFVVFSYLGLPISWSWPFKFL